MAKKTTETEQFVSPTTPEELATDTPAVIAEEQAPVVTNDGKVQFEESPTELDVEKQLKKQKTQRIIKNVFVYIFLTVCALFAFLPFYWMVITSFKTESDYRDPVPSFFPRQWFWGNYGAALNQSSTSQVSNFWQILINTLVVGFLSTTLGVILTILTAYAFARMNFKGKNILFVAMLATMMIPGEMFTLSNYLTVTKAGWSNTYIVLILPFLVSVYYIYLLRNNFMQIPNSLYQAAKVDGLSDMGYLIKVMVPLTAPTLVSITLLKFIGTWNSYIWPRLVNKRESWQIITNWVSRGFTDMVPNMYGGTYGTNTLDTIKMAAVCMVSLPLFVLFVTCRKYIMRGVSKSGTKG